MTVKLLLLMLTIALSVVTTHGQDNYRPRKKDLSWGEKANGQRMAVWTNPVTDKVFGVARNFSSRKICYCEPPTDNFTVFARTNPAAPWQKIELTPPIQTVEVILMCDVRTLKPQEEMRPYALPQQNHSFAVDLREYSFPPGWRGIVEVKIFQTHHYCNQYRYSLGDVGSLVKIKLPLSEPAAR